MPRGRPKVEGETQEWDIRLTPTDQNPIDFDSLDLTDFKVLLICKEGEPNGQPRLHYHMYAITARSDSYLDKWLNTIGKATPTIKGNAVFSKRKKHEGTIGYVIKSGEVVCRHGLSQTMIDEYYNMSQEYRKAKESERKRAYRKKENFLKLIMSEVAEVVESDPSAFTLEQIMALLLRKYFDHQITLPNRTTLENATLTIMYKHNPTIVEKFYSKNFFFL